MAEPTISNYPSALDSDTSLGGDQVNIKSFTLGSGIGTGETSIPASAAISGVNAPFYLLADSELIYVEGVSGSDFTPSVRGAGGTTAASHSAGITLYVVYAANLFNQLKRAIVAIETELGIAPSGSFSDLVSRIDALQYLPDGTMINGKISPAVVSNDLVLSLLASNTGLAATATNPIAIKINGTVRTVTSSLSITLADATNWFNAGAAELATQEIDFFAYAVWDSDSSAVAIAPARISHGRVVSDFSGTSTDEKYLGGHSGYAATDDVVVIGRFAATLSAGAAYTWSVPTYTSKNLIQRPTYKTRVLNWSPQWTNVTVGDGTMTATYSINENTVEYHVDLIFGSTSAISGDVSHTLPFTRGTYAGVASPFLGTLRLQDFGVAGYFGPVIVAPTGSTFRALVATGTYTNIASLSSAIPFTWGTSDEIVEWARYFID